VTAPSRATIARQAYLDLRRKACQDRRPVDELIQLYVRRASSPLLHCGGPLVSRHLRGSRCRTGTFPPPGAPTPADACYRLAVAEDELARAPAKMKRADQAFDAASDQVNAAEAALDAAPGKSALRPAGTGTPSARPTTAPVPPLPGCSDGWPSCLSSLTEWSR
jgi:hypothetical protein